MMGLQPGVTVVVPVYKGEATLDTLAARLEPVLKTLGEGFEVIFVNDGSPDRSWEAISSLVAKHRWVRGINLIRNFGQHNATLCGIRAARFDRVVTIDDDLQSLPEDIPLLLHELSAGSDVVYGTPIARSHGFWRNLSAVITKQAFKLVLRYKNAQQASSFRAFRTELRRAFDDFRGSHLSVDALLSWGASSYGTVGVRSDPRRSGESNYTFGKLVVHAINVMTAFSTLPLRIASLIGLFFTVFGFGILIYVVWNYFTHDSVPGFSFLASMLAIFSGVQLFCLGIIGEYLARVHMRTMDRPTYVIQAELPPEEQSCKDAR